MDRIAMLRARVMLHERTRVRHDFNPNHDEKNGEFTSAPEGSSGVITHTTLKDAKSQAKTTSTMFSGKTHVKDSSGKVLHTYYQGKELKTTPDTAQRIKSHSMIGVTAMVIGAGGKVESVTQINGGAGIKSRAALARKSAATPAAKVGRTFIPADKFEKVVRTGKYSVLTAANPMSKPQDARANATAMRSLYKDLVKSGAEFHPTIGHYGSKEPSVMVMHNASFGPKEAEALGEKYHQTSVLHADAGKATIKYTSGDFKGRVGRSMGLEFNQGASDYYTEHRGHKFGFTFPDSTWTNPEKE